MSVIVTSKTTTQKPLVPKKETKKETKKDSKK